MESNQKKQIGNLLRPRLKFDLNGEDKKRAFEWMKKVGPRLSSEILVGALVYAPKKITPIWSGERRGCEEGGSISFLGEFVYIVSGKELEINRSEIQVIKNIHHLHSDWTNFS